MLERNQNGRQNVAKCLFRLDVSLRHSRIRSDYVRHRRNYCERRFHGKDVKRRECANAVGPGRERFADLSTAVWHVRTLGEMRRIKLCKRSNRKRQVGHTISPVNWTKKKSALHSCLLNHYRFALFLSRDPHRVSAPAIGMLSARTHCQQLVCGRQRRIPIGENERGTKETEQMFQNDI